MQPTTAEDPKDTHTAVHNTDVLHKNLSPSMLTLHSTADCNCNLEPPQLPTVQTLADTACLNWAMQVRTCHGAALAAAHLLHSSWAEVDDAFLTAASAIATFAVASLRF
jgi:hypothetical protein